MKLGDHVVTERKAYIYRTHPNHYHHRSITRCLLPSIVSTIVTGAMGVSIGWDRIWSTLHVQCRARPRYYYESLFGIAGPGKNLWNVDARRMHVF